MPSKVTDPALLAELNGTSTKVTDPALLAELNGPPPQQPSVLDNIAQAVKGDLGTALKAGIAASASKTVRGIGTTLLPKSLETWAERHGMPTAQDVELLDQAAATSTPAHAAQIASDVATDLLPVSKGLAGAKTLASRVGRSAAVGAGMSGMRAEGDNVLPEAGLGAAGGGLGELGAFGLTKALSHLVKPSEQTRELMRYGVVPTLGEGVDRSRVTGRVLHGIENQLESMPFAGMPVRTAKDQVTGQLFDAAANIAAVPNRSLPTGTPPEVARQLLADSTAAIGDALRGTNVRISPAHQAGMNQLIDDLATQHSLPQHIADQMKVDINGLFWSGVRNGRVSGNTLEHLKDDLYAGLRSTRNSSNAQQVANEVARQVKEWTDNAAAAAGQDLVGARHAASSAHVLRRARVGEEGVSGPNLLSAVRANDQAMGSADTVTREMRDLAENAQGVTSAHRPMGNRNIGQMSRDLGLGAVKEAMLSGTGGLGHATALGYGQVNKSEFARRLLMNDPQAFIAALRAVSPISSAVGINRGEKHAP